MVVVIPTFDRFASRLSRAAIASATYNLGSLDPYAGAVESLERRLRDLPKPVREVILRVSGTGSPSRPGWTVCIRNAEGDKLVAEFVLGSHQQVSKLALDLAQHGLFLTVEDGANCDFVFEPTGLAR
jgi:hypothetical protein